MDDLAAASDGTDATALTSSFRPVVVESDDRRQAERFLSRLVPAQPPGPAPSMIVLRYATAGTGRRRATPAGRISNPESLGNAALARLTGDRLALYDSVLDAGRQLRPGELTTIIERSRHVRELTVRLAARLLQDVPARTRALLGFAALLGYCHPDLGSLAPVLETCAVLPWWTELTGRWRHFEPAWRDGALAVCHSNRRPQGALLGRLVGELVEDGAAAEAVELCLDAGCPGTASDLLAEIGPDLLSAGQPLSVQRWLRRLPWTVRRRHRALAGQVRAARRQDGQQWEMPIAAPMHQWTRPADAPSAGPGQPPGAPRPDGTPPLPVSVSPLAVQARLLGPVDVSIGGHRVEHWHGRKGTLLLAYLLLHRGDRPASRDALAVNFWPDAPPGASRNRLHVTLHTLRTDLLTASPTPVVLFEHGYTLNPELEIRLDTEEFEKAVAHGSKTEKNNDVETALAAYRDAIREYGGDLLSDHPYDGWTLLPREHYRVRMLDVLGRAAQLTFEAGRYADSVETGQRLLALDFCREDLHRLLMRAYARLGRPHLALHQFEICAQQLRRELDMAPARETVELYRRIRARAPV
jgi:DNA-binding SARP family transcriptional activator